MNCPNCKSEIPSENLNIQADIGKCNHCGHVFKISASVVDSDAKFDINEPPKGAWYRRELDDVIIGASTQHWIAFFIVPFMVIWSSFALGGIYGTQIISGNFSPLMSLFGLPFLLGAIIFWYVALMTIWGKVEVTLRGQEGKVFTGVGKIGITKKFNWKDISRIDEGVTTYRYPGNRGVQIVLEGKKRLAFGSGLSEERRYYLLQALRKMHSQYSR